MRKTLSELYEEYKIQHNSKPKHSFHHFIVVITNLEHHKTIIRPQIIWWSEVFKKK